MELIVASPFRRANMFTETEWSQIYPIKLQVLRLLTFAKWSACIVHRKGNVVKRFNKLAQQWHIHLSNMKNARKKLKILDLGFIMTGSRETVAWRCPIHDQAYEMKVKNRYLAGAWC